MRSAVIAGVVSSLGLLCLTVYLAISAESVALVAIYMGVAWLLGWLTGAGVWWMRYVFLSEKAPEAVPEQRDYVDAHDLLTDFLKKKRYGD